MCKAAVATVQKQCQRCGDVFLGNARGWRKNCDECNAAIRTEHDLLNGSDCTECGKRYPRSGGKATSLCGGCWFKKRKQESNERQTRTCEACGKAFIRKIMSQNTGRACSRECGFIVSARGKRKEAEDKAPHREAQRVQERYRRLFEYFRTCKQCNKAFIAGSSNQRLCGDECRREDARVAALIAYNKGEMEKTCSGCGGFVESRVTAKRKTYRAALCNSCAREQKRISKRLAKRRYETKRTGVTRNGAGKDAIAKLRQLIQRAGSRCPCCGLLMTKGINPCSDRALELDHMLPVSRGGCDTFENIRPTCRRCNGLKGAFVAPHIVIGEWMNTQTVGAG